MKVLSYLLHFIKSYMLHFNRDKSKKLFQITIMGLYSLLYIYPTLSTFIVFRRNKKMMHYGKEICDVAPHKPRAQMSLFALNSKHNVYINLRIGV